MADGIDAYPSWEDRIVAEFGDGHDVYGIAARHGLTVEQVYAVVERVVGPDQPGPGAQYPPPGSAAPGQGYYGPPAYQPPPPPPWQQPPPAAYAPPPAYQPWQQPPPAAYAPPSGYPDEDAIVADYAEGHGVEAIARKHGLSVERVYDVVRRAVTDGQPPTG